jgi:hypothetical protein
MAKRRKAARGGGVRDTRSVAGFLRNALAKARELMPAHGSRFSPRVFSEHQLFAILALKRRLGLDYRAVVGLLKRAPRLRRRLRLTNAPHPSTLCYAQRRFLRNGLHRELNRFASLPDEP